MVLDVGIQRRGRELTCVCGPVGPALVRTRVEARVVAEVDRQLSAMASRNGARLDWGLWQQRRATMLGCC